MFKHSYSTFNVRNVQGFHGVSDVSQVEKPWKLKCHLIDGVSKKINHCKCWHKYIPRSTLLVYITNYLLLITIVVHIQSAHILGHPFKPPSCNSASNKTSEK